MNIQTLHVPYLGQFTNSYTFTTEHYRIFIDSALKSNESNVRPLLDDGRKPIVLLTHGHWDHIGCNGLIKAYGGEIWANENDLPWLSDFGLHWRIGFEQFRQEVTVPPERWDTFWNEIGEKVSIDRWVGDGEILQFDDVTIQAIALPGHSKGSVGYYLPDEDVLFTGDALMHTGFFGGLAQYYDKDAYRTSMAKLADLNPETVYTAHTSVYENHSAAQAAKEAIDFSMAIEERVREYVASTVGKLSVGDCARYVCGLLGKKVGCGACICTLNHMIKLPEAAGRLNVTNFLCGI